jgi:hypothetical protein
MSDIQQCVSLGLLARTWRNPDMLTAAIVTDVQAVSDIVRRDRCKLIS